MNYELAKELKDAGFPQSGQFGFSRKRDGSPVYNGPAYLINDEDWVVAPTLEELIEACGDGFLSLSRWQSGNSWHWYCNDDETGAVASEGTTPAEAVARLYLALNKK